jgi:hypothetical protein
MWSILNTKLEHEYYKFLVQYIKTFYNNTKITSPQIKYSNQNTSMRQIPNDIS